MLRTAAVLGALAGGSLVAAEAIARFGLGFGTPPLYQRDSQLEYRFRPNQTLTRFGHRIAINNLGLRGAPVAPLPRAGSRRLLIFGDSVVWGGAQLDQGVIATTLLPALLGGPKPVEVVAAATPSWGPANWLAFARRYGHLGAQQALVVISSHDAADWPSFQPLEQQPDKPTATPRFALQELIGRYGWEALLRWVKVPPASPSASLPYAEQERRSLNALGALMDRLRAQGVEVVALQFWDRTEMASGRLEPGHAAVAAVLAQQGVATTQAGPAMAACAQKAGDQPLQLFVDAIHPYTPLGQRCLAQALAAALR